MRDICEIWEYLKNQDSEAIKIVTQMINALKNKKYSEYFNLWNKSLNHDYETLMRLSDELSYLNDSPKTRELERQYEKFLKRYNIELEKYSKFVSMAEEKAIKEGKMDIKDSVYYIKSLVKGG